MAGQSRFVAPWLAGGAIALALLAGCSDSGSGAAPQRQAGGPIQVGVVTLKPQSTAKITELPGRASAFSTAQIQPQVTGIITQIAFKENGPVKAGDVLYKLDDKPYVAARDAAAATLKKAQATVASAQVTFNRNQTLARSNTVAVQTLDDAQAALLEAQADQETAQAQLEAAQINLNYAVITAPISGIISISSVSVGSLVTANQTTAMATIRQIEPIYVDLVDSSANLLNLRQQISQGRVGMAQTDGKPTPPKVSLTLENGQPYAETGIIDSADTAVSETTGTFSIRATFDNKDRILLPGMYTRAKVDLGTVNNVFLVPQRAVNRATSGAAQAYIVSADGKAEVATLETDGSTATAWIVTSGVKEGDKVIVDGLTKVSGGSAVTPVEVTINDQGVVQEPAQPAAVGPAPSQATKP